MVKKLNLENAFPPMDDGFERAASRAFGQIREEQNMKCRNKFSMALAMLLVLALAGTALAARISRMRQELEAINATGAMEAVQDVNQIIEVDGCAIAVKETLVEGARAWVTIEIKTPDNKPMLMTYWEDHPDITFSAGLREAYRMVGGEYGSELVVASADWGYMQIEDLLVNLEFAFMEPTKEVMVERERSVWDIIFEKKYSVPGEYLTVLDGDEYPVYIGNWANEEVDIDQLNRNTVWHEGTIANMEKAGVIQNTRRITVPLELKCEKEGAYMRHNVKQTEFQFDGYRVVIADVSFGELEGALTFHVIPEREMEHMTMDNDDPLWRHYSLIDDETGTHFTTSNSGGTAEDETGKVYYEKLLHVRCIGEHSDRIRVIPEENDRLIEDEAFVIELIP